MRTITAKGTRKVRLAVWRSVALMIVLGALVGACSFTSDAGGNTTCQKYLSMSTSSREAAIKTMMKQDHQVVETGAVYVAEGSAVAYCAIYGGSAKIDGIYGG